MFAFMLNVTATVYSQVGKVSLQLEDQEIADVLREIEEKTEYSFFYQREQIDVTRKVSVQVDEQSVKSVLDQIFEGENIQYHISKNNTVILLPKLEQDSKALQGFKVIGQVSDKNGVTLPGVNVVIKGKDVGTITDINGNFSIVVEEGELLVFSFIGFFPQEVKVNAKVAINIILEEEAIGLNEVVVVGYGTMRKSSVVGAVSQISSEAIENKPVRNVSQALQGAAANLIIQDNNSEPGAGTNITIRGISTMNNNSPLVVIDGIIGGDLDLINPSDIESISVLKDAGSAAIYGSRSANGVILITTKKGKKNTAPSVTLNSQVGIQTPNILFEPVKGYENAILRNQAMVNAGNSPIYEASEIQMMKEQGDNEWFFDAITQDALQQNHNISVSGGGEYTTYNVSLGYLDQESVFVGPNYGLKRTNFRVNLSSEYGKFKFTTTVAYANTNLKTHTTTGGFLIADATRTPVDYRYKLKDENGRYLINDVLSQHNPLGVLEEGGIRESDDDNIIANLSAEFQIYKDLKIKGVFGADVKANHSKGMVNEVLFYSSSDAIAHSGTYGSDLNTDDSNEKIRFYNSQLILEYNKDLENHTISGLLGISNESYKREANRIRLKFTDPDLHIPTSGTEYDESSEVSPQATSERSINSIFGRIGYTYQDKYLFEGNFRYDGTSKFSKEHRWGFFPSASVGWRATEEQFLATYKDKVGDLKFRSSYGILGNQNVDDYIFYSTYFFYNGSYGFNNKSVAGTGLQLGNEELQWEESKNFNIGLDATFFGNKLSISADYFNTLTTDILLEPVVPGTFGGTVATYNSGEMRSKGWELTLNYHLKHNDFIHDIGFNIADSRNEVEHFDDNQRIESSDQMQKITQKGLVFNSYYGYKTDGYFQNIDEILNDPKPIGADVSPGDIRYKDKNGDGVIDDEDRYVLGNAFPRYTFGLTYNLKWKNFDFSALIQGVGKRKMFLRGELVEPFHANYSYTMYDHQFDFWTPTNPNAEYPRLSAPGSASNTNNYGRSSDLYIFDASYIRLKNIQIGYTLPQTFTKRAGIQKARFFINAQNLLTLSHQDFINPESTEFNNNMSSDSANSGRSYPTPKYYGVGVDINF